jgi:hypothetical protein
MDGVRSYDGALDRQVAEDDPEKLDCLDGNEQRDQAYPREFPLQNQCG